MFPTLPTNVMCCCFVNKFWRVRGFFYVFAFSFVVWNIEMLHRIFVKDGGDGTVLTLFFGCAYFWL